MNPKKLLIILLAAAAVAAVTLPATSEAGSYRSRIEGTCGYCRGPVYAYYRPIGYSRYGNASYSWVTSHHTSCRSSYRGSYARSRPVFNLNFGVSPSPFFNSGTRTFGSPSFGYNSRRYRSSSYRRGRYYCR